MNLTNKAYELIIKMSHLLNIIDSKKAKANEVKTNVEREKEVVEGEARVINAEKEVCEREMKEALKHQVHGLYPLELQSGS
jgi:glycyl-tRNA synthetase alpha subunit